ncbi:MAG: hypothetical protein JOZ07_13505 [Solirubrobacterales bacterium]|nr:hypothetical protein [Solirubrobacterales bacterium]
MVELDHQFSSDQPVAHTWETLHDLDKLIPCVQGGTVLETTAPDSAKAEIRVKLGALSVRFRGTVTIIESDADTHHAVVQVKSREVGGQGHADADVTFDLSDGGGRLHTKARVTGKAASRGEGMVSTVLDAMITDFTEKFAAA